MTGFSDFLGDTVNDSVSHLNPNESTQGRRARAEYFHELEAPRIGLDSTQPQEIAAAFGVVLALAIAGVALTTLRPQVKRDEVERAYDLFCARVAAIGAPRLLAETASRYLERIDPLLEPDDADLAREIVETYSQLRYDPGTSSPKQVRDLQRLVKAFKP
jgi:hypothetical protein